MGIINHIIAPIPDMTVVALTPREVKFYSCPAVTTQMDVAFGVIDSEQKIAKASWVLLASAFKETHVPKTYIAK